MTPESPIHPLRTSIWLAACYIGIGSVYIVVSTQLVADTTTSIAEATRLEVIKGVLFVCFSGLLLFGVTLFFLRRIKGAIAGAQQTREALARAEQRALVGLLAAGVAHDFNNILTVIGVAVENVRTDDSESAAAVLSIRRGLARGAALARGLGQAAQSKRGQPETVDLRQLIESALVLLRTLPVVRDSQIRIAGSPQAPARIYPGFVTQILENLILNSVEAKGGPVEIEVRLTGQDPEHILEVHDNGPGIPLEKREQVFDPLYSTKERGTGLGLVSVQSCAAMHKGGVSILDSPLGGACFRVTLRSLPA